MSCSWFPNLKRTWPAKWSFLFLADASASIKWGFMLHQMARNSGPGQELSLRTKLSKERSKKIRIDEVRGRQAAAVEWSPVADCYSSCNWHQQLVQAYCSSGFQNPKSQLLGWEGKIQNVPKAEISIFFLRPTAFFAPDSSCNYPFQKEGGQSKARKLWAKIAIGIERNQLELGKWCWIVWGLWLEPFDSVTPRRDKELTNSLLKIS